MAQPNVAREPSMEEILASIRRIIESNEPGAGKTISSSLPPVYAEEDESEEEIQLTIDNDNGVIPSFEDDMRADEDTVSQAAFAREDVPQVRPVERDNLRVIEERKAMSLADVAARVRAASERGGVQRDVQEPRPEAVPAPRAVSATRPVELRQPPQLTAANEPRLSMPKPITAYSSEQNFSEEEPIAALSRVVQPVSRTPAPTGNETASARSVPEAQPVRDHAEVDLPEQPETESKALLSSVAGDMVARSFGELAAAFDSGARRSFDEIAEDMLRPMLQEWLDDNLPTLVERLVREEIERVARGHRR